MRIEDLPPEARERLRGSPVYQAWEREQKQKQLETAQDQIGQQAQAASRFGDTGERGYAALGAEAGALRQQLGRYASGQDSLSAEQLRQSLQQNQAAQQSFAAGARPGMQAMAARTAAMQMGRNATGMAGNQAMAGIAERQAATQSLGNMIGQLRGQDLQAALNSRTTSMGGYGQQAGQLAATMPRAGGDIGGALLQGGQAALNLYTTMPGGNARQVAPQQPPKRHPNDLMPLDY